MPIRFIYGTFDGYMHLRMFEKSAIAYNVLRREIHGYPGIKQQDNVDVVLNTEHRTNNK